MAEMKKDIFTIEVIEPSYTSNRTKRIFFL